MTPDMRENDTRLEFFFRTQEYWDAMYNDCARAAESLEMEQYILMDDEAGGRFIDLFIKKAQEGVKVRLMLDAVGCRKLVFTKRVEDMRKAGCEVRYFNALWWKNLVFPSRWLPRTHVKTMLIDSRVVYTGSACIWNLMRDWHDMHLRIEGAPAAAVKEDLDRQWGCAVKGKWRCAPQPRGVQEGPFRYVVSEPHLGTSPLYRELLERIRNAKKYVRIVTPYFLPPRRLRKALEQAAGRGVRVEIISSRETDVPLADHTSHIYFPRLLAKGLRLFLFPDHVLHAKYMMVDDDWATVGSVNVDYLSLTKNREASIVIRDPGTISYLWSQSGTYLRFSERVGPDFWRKIPAHAKIAGYLGRYMKEVL